MNEAVNKPDDTGRSAGLRQPRRAPFAARAAKGFIADETSMPKKRTEIKSIPFDGLLTNKLLARLPGEEFARLMPFLEPVSLARGDYLYAPGDEVVYCYLLETAVVSQIHLLEDGGTTEVAIVGKEGVIGLSAIFGAPAPSYWSEAIVSGSALRIRVEILREEFARGGALQRLLLAYTNERLGHISQRAACNGRHTLSGRLCCWLLMVDDRVSNNQLTLTHEEIARHLGARRASISVAATQLRERSVINYNRGKVSILNREALEACACECYRALVQNAEVARQESHA